jgi:hypothetical protein
VYQDPAWLANLVVMLIDADDEAVREVRTAVVGGEMWLMTGSLSQGCRPTCPYIVPRDSNHSKIIESLKNYRRFVACCRIPVEVPNYIDQVQYGRYGYRQDKFQDMPILPQRPKPQSGSRWQPLCMCSNEVRCQVGKRGNA